MRLTQKLGWALMGYPYGLPFWASIYRLGGRIHDWMS